MICSPAGAHHRRWSFVILLIAIAVAATEGPWVSSVRAQGVLIPAPTKQANDMAPYKAAIEQVLTTKVQELADPSADVQAKARIQLENEARIPGQKDPPTPAYLDVYTRTLNKLIDTIKTNESVRIRLNAALAVANIAKAADNENLKDAVQTFVQDKNPAVVLWGVKGAKYIIPAQLRAGQLGTFNPSLVKAVIDAVKTHKDGAIAGAIAGEAYDALTLDISSNPGALATIAKAQPKSIPTIAPFVLDLLKARVQMYRKGVPASPRADAAGTRFLTDSSVWGVLTPAQRDDVMQTISDLISLAGKQAGFPQANKGDVRDLAYTIQRAASAISTVLPVQLRPKLDPVVNLKETAAAAQVQQAAESVPPVVKEQYKDLKPAPEITGHEAAPAPASAPTTGPVSIPGAPPPGATPPAAATPAPAPAPPTHTPTAPKAGTTPAKPATPAKPPAGAAAHPPTPTKPPDAR